MSIQAEFSGKVAIITGSSSGIGEFTAVELSRLGASVTITGRNDDRLAAVSEKCKKISPSNLEPLVLAGDLSDEEFMKKLVDQTLEKFGRLDVLINNAGVMQSTSVLEPLLENFDSSVKVLLRSPMHLTHLCAKHLIQTKGVIINVSSITGIRPLIGFPIYCSLKSALDMFTKVSALELAPHGARVISINPGAIETPLIQSAVQTTLTVEVKDTVAAAHALGRVAQPEEVATMIAFLASKNASFMTGSNVIFDGGLHLLSRDIRPMH